MADEIREFGRGDDDAYEEWVRQHRGYVLVKRGPDDYMLHHAECTHLDLTTGQFSLTQRPRRVSERARTLFDWAQEETGKKPARCSSCM